MTQKVKSLLQQRKALSNDLDDSKDELAYLNRVTRISSTSNQRARRHELQVSIKEMSQWIDSIDYTLAEIQWREGESA